MTAAAVGAARHVSDAVAQRTGGAAPSPRRPSPAPQFAFETLPTLTLRYVIRPCLLAAHFSYEHILTPLGRAIKKATYLVLVALPKAAFRYALVPGVTHVLVCPRPMSASLGLPDVARLSCVDRDRHPNGNRWRRVGDHTALYMRASKGAESHSKHVPRVRVSPVQSTC